MSTRLITSLPLPMPSRMKSQGSPSTRPSRMARGATMPVLEAAHGVVEVDLAAARGIAPAVADRESSPAASRPSRPTRHRAGEVVGREEPLSVGRKGQTARADAARRSAADRAGHVQGRQVVGQFAITASGPC